MRLLAFVVTLGFFFYLIPFAAGYVLGRNWGESGRRWGGWTVTGFYAGWMLLTWFREGYSPVSAVRLVSVERTWSGTEVYSLVIYIALILLTFLVVYSGARHGVRLGYARSTRKGVSSIEPRI